ncbi:MAG: Bug family tripartite tricarboxylate transporter substrate binding protein [Burkholderiales bacterium]
MRFFIGCALAGLALLTPLGANAQGYPNKPVRMVVASTPGSALDIHARLLGNQLAEIWKQPVVMDYKPGASMAIGADYVAKATPDGYTLFFSIDTPFVVNMATLPNLPYAMADFAPISFWSVNPFVLVVNAALPAKSVPELIALLKLSPGKYNASSASASTVLTHELMKSLAGVDYAVINYKGGIEAIASTAAGETQLAFYDLGNAQAMLRAGKIRALAQTPAQRSRVIPDIPTVAEAGVPGFEGGTWSAVFAPAKTPREVIGKINADIRRVVEMPDIAAKLTALGVEPRASSPEELSKHIAESTARWVRLVKERNIKLAQ